MAWWMMGYISQRNGVPLAFRRDKAAEAIAVIARKAPGAMQDFVSQCLYLADKTHFLDWGRPITFDRYAATDDGPVPCAVRNMLLAAADLANGLDGGSGAVALEHAAALRRLVIVEGGARLKLFPVQPAAPTPHLSATDVECLEAAVDTVRNDRAAFDCSHHMDAAWREAWTRAQGGMAEIDVLLWADPHERAGFAAQLVRYAAYA
jgi:hypothetical protein